ncbi:thiamine monophosphate kinase [Hylemonella gracilis str. Niagara R]|uniref:Thiamine-monophosphate kinase n=1 Tax=Hylemonella gracilis str. Niagara R TaxID=1458275 RepID=A0A016XG19_9BURK|nr:thiamine-phosphate kinase [Hylemonella gracilis]EYC50143.1 thiamine monophosphate kinase [Hylemonella gracilis str. Niagara R]
MALGEFELIARYFQRQAAPVHPAVALGIGDDCALLQTPPGAQLAISSDMLVEGQHFFPDVDPEALGHKALAVNLSDLAACGAQPLAFTLALALPDSNVTREAWIKAFTHGLFALADAQGCTLMGGDTTRGPLNICITVFGAVPTAQGRSQALLRSGAKAGDDIWVSGTLGDARLALLVLKAQRGERSPSAQRWLQLPPEVLKLARARLERPSPRVALGLALRGIASACMDLSDGLVGDLQHILEASGCGARLLAPVLSELLATHRLNGTVLTPPERLSLALSGGDDYELLFTAPSTQRAAVMAAAVSADTPVTRIGQIEAQEGLRVVDAQGQRLAGRFASFDHFA